MPLDSPHPVAVTVTPNVSQDAVVVIPGILGSELWDTTTGQLLWGLQPSWYARAWSSRDTLRALMLTDEERAGRIGRVTATRLLQAPAFCPVLAGFEPYTKLVDQIRSAVASPRALLEFAYDWRLPVEHNARRLATAAVRRTRPDGRPAQLVLVAHSMGGLLCRALALISGATDEVRTTITLGAPFDGAVKAAVLLGSGRGGPMPLPRRRLRRLAATLPGLHDLLPMYRCVDDGDEVRWLTPTDVAALGGDAELAKAAQECHARLAQVPLTGHRAVIGTEQPTVQSFRLRAGTVLEEAFHTFLLHSDGEFVRNSDGTLRRVDRRGDGTVPRNSANPVGTEPVAVPQQHGSLPATDNVIAFVRSVITDQDIDWAPRLGGDIGLQLPDVVTPGAEWAVTVTGVAPHEAACTVTNLQTGLTVEQPPLHRRDGQVQATVSLPTPGLFRIAVYGGSTSPVSQLVMAEHTMGPSEDDD